MVYLRGDMQCQWSERQDVETDEENISGHGYNITKERALDENFMESQEPGPGTWWVDGDKIHLEGEGWFSAYIVEDGFPCGHAGGPKGTQKTSFKIDEFINKFENTYKVESKDD